jgi:hypothetical protein
MPKSMLFSGTWDTVVLLHHVFGPLCSLDIGGGAMMTASQRMKHEGLSCAGATLQHGSQSLNSHN